MVPRKISPSANGTPELCTFYTGVPAATFGDGVARGLGRPGTVGRGPSRAAGSQRFRRQGGLGVRLGWGGVGWVGRKRCACRWERGGCGDSTAKSPAQRATWANMILVLILSTVRFSRAVELYLRTRTRVWDSCVGLVCETGLPPARDITSPPPPLPDLPPSLIATPSPMDGRSRTRWLLATRRRNGTRR